MTNEQIKQKVKKSIGNQKIKKGYDCQNCNEKTVHQINFQEEKMTCEKCNNQMIIDERFYIDVYEQLKQLGIR